MNINVMQFGIRYSSSSDLQHSASTFYQVWHEAMFWKKNVMGYEYLSIFLVCDLLQGTQNV